MELNLLCSRDFVICKILRTPAKAANPGANPLVPAMEATTTTSATF